MNIDEKRIVEQSTDAAEFLNQLTGGPLTFGDAVRSARELIEISQTELAHRLGVGRQSICDVEKGRTLSVSRRRPNSPRPWDTMKRYLSAWHSRTKYPKQDWI